MFGSINILAGEVNVFYEIIGYAGMAFIILSFVFKKIAVLRLLNLIGGTLCAIYGFLTWTLPTMILNIGLCLINGIYLILYQRDYLKKKAQAKAAPEEGGETPSEEEKKES